jgi:hypothetical protein
MYVYTFIFAALLYILMQVKEEQGIKNTSLTHFATDSVMLSRISDAISTHPFPPIRLHGVVLDQLSTEATLHFTQMHTHTL